MLEKTLLDFEQNSSCDFSVGYGKMLSRLLLRDAGKALIKGVLFGFYILDKIRLLFPNK